MYETTGIFQDRKECNIMLGELMGIHRTLTDLPKGYAGLDYLESYATLREALRNIILAKGTRGGVIMKKPDTFKEWCACVSELGTAVMGLMVGAAALILVLTLVYLVATGKLPPVR